MEQRKEKRKPLWSRKFKGFRRLHLAAVILFFASLAGEIIWLGGFGLSLRAETVGLMPFFRRLLFWEMMTYLAVFFMGVTVYAPALLFLLSFGRGAWTGFLLSVLFYDPNGLEGVLFSLLGALWLFLSAWLQMAYATFCASVSLRLFSTGVLRDPKREEERLFGGVLFNSSLYRGTVNPRFLGSYFLFFLGATLLSALLTLVYALLRTLFS